MKTLSFSSFLTFLAIYQANQKQRNTFVATSSMPFNLIATIL